MSSPGLPMLPPPVPPDHGGNSSSQHHPTSRPSDARRKALNEQLSVPMVSNFFSIERYYDAADKVYDSFQAAWSFGQGPNLDEAYLYGKRYCTFCLDAIPTHNYYSASRYERLKTKHVQQVSAVLSLLEVVAERMDIEEYEKQQKEALERAKREQEQYEELARRASQFTTISPAAVPAVKASPQSLEASALSKLDLLRNAMTQENNASSKKKISSGSSTEDELTIKRDPSGEKPGIPSSRYRLLSDSEDDGGEEKKSSGVGGIHSFPPPIPPPTSAVEMGGIAPPSYHQVVAASTHLNGRHHNQRPPQPLLPPTMTEPKAKRRERVPMRILQEEYRNAYVQATAYGKIEVMGIDTYQGRKSLSTNGCTVISALVAARHLTSGSGSSSATTAISDASIVDVIDRQCGPILQKIRSKLGLGPSALIIPSDVHDHLVDAKLLQQDSFEGAAGGSVMDPQHMGEFLKLLAVGNDGKGALRKAAATFFFHEHVVSIVKLPPPSRHNNNGSSVASPPPTYYDLVDSLPGLNTGGRSMATRTRCEGIDALAILLRWYTSRKFTDANCAHIDRNAWDDAMADIDPRVFQGFVWSNREPDKGDNTTQ